MTRTKFSRSEFSFYDHYAEPNPTIEGWMTPLELDWLYQNAKRKFLILEVGSWKGRSTHALLSSGSRVIVVDTFEGTPNELETAHREAKYVDIFSSFILNVGRFRKLSVLRMNSVSASNLFEDKTFDMIFLDGSHEYTFFKDDVENWLPKCISLFCGHDLHEGDTFRVLEDLKIYYTKGPGSIWYCTL